jgi:hypothetical protein
VVACLQSSLGRRSSVVPLVVSRSVSSCILESASLESWGRHPSSCCVHTSKPRCPCCCHIACASCFAPQSSTGHCVPCFRRSWILDFYVLGVLESFAFACHDCTVCAAVASLALYVSRSSARRLQHSVFSRNLGCSRSSRISVEVFGLCCLGVDPVVFALVAHRLCAQLSRIALARFLFITVTASTGLGVVF